MHYGVEHVNVTVNYLAEQIEEHFKEKYGVEMPIVEEAYGVLYKDYDINSSMENLMLRDKRKE